MILKNVHKLFIISIAIVLIAAILLFLFRRTDSSDVAGGPCSYKTIKYPATIINIECVAIDSSFFELTLRVDYGGYVDTLDYSNEFDQLVSGEDMLEKQYKIGQQMTYEHMQIVSGSCNPDIFTLKMEPFIADSLQQKE